MRFLNSLIRFLNVVYNIPRFIVINLQDDTEIKFGSKNSKENSAIFAFNHQWRRSFNSSKRNKEKNIFPDRQ